MPVLRRDHSGYMGVESTTGVPPKRIFILFVVITGATGMLSQIILLRELLVTFLGNELSIGVILANWLLLEALGSYFIGKRIENRRRKIELLVALNAVFLLLLPCSLYAARIVRGLFGFNPGEGLGAAHMFLFSFLILLPVGLIHGALFTFSCKIYSELTGSQATSAGVVYIFEILGTALGGILFTYLLLPLLDPFQIVFGIVFLNLLASLFLLLYRFSQGPVPRILTCVVLGLIGSAVYFTLTGRASEWHMQSVEQAWPKQRIVYYGNSPYGNIVVTQQEEQYNLFSDGISVITIPTPDVEFIEEFVHFPLLFHPKPDEVLVISGGAGGVLREIGKHPVSRIDYAELDPLIIRTLDAISPPSIKAEWHDPRVFVYTNDGRNHLRITERKYDVILIGLSNPSDLQANRLFTVEFFHLAKKRINEGGILLLTLPGSLTYLNRELKQLNACLWITLKEAYEHVRVIPGDLNLYLASDSPELSRLNADDLSRRLEERQIAARLFTPFYIRYRLQERRSEWFMKSIKDTEVRLNRDYKPTEVYYSLSLWNAKFSPFLERIFQHFGQLKLAPLLMPCVFVIIFFLFLQRVSPKSLITAAVPFAVVTSGFCGMLFDLIVVIGYQVLYGSLYYKVGLLMTSFMIGTGLGGIMATLFLKKIDRIGIAFILLETAVILFSVILPIFFLNIIPLWQAKSIPASVEILFYGLGVVGGFLIGAEFPIAVKIHLRTGTDFSKSVGFLNASDLIGGWVGGLVGGIILVPILGLGGTCTFMVAIKLTVLVLLVLSRKLLLPPARRGS
jgi:spermidine synthase